MFFGRLVFQKLLVNKAIYFLLLSACLANDQESFEGWIHLNCEIEKAEAIEFDTEDIATPPKTVSFELDWEELSRDSSEPYYYVIGIVGPRRTSAETAVAQLKFSKKESNVSELSSRHDVDRKKIKDSIQEAWGQRNQEGSIIYRLDEGNVERLLRFWELVLGEFFDDVIQKTSANWWYIINSGKAGNNVSKHYEFFLIPISSEAKFPNGGPKVEKTIRFEGRYFGFVLNSSGECILSKSTCLGGGCE